MWLAPILLTIALFQPGDAVILELPSPGFGSGIPHTVQINVYDASLAFRSTLPSPASDASSAFVFAPNGDLFITEPFAVVRYDAFGTRVGVFARFSTTPTLLAFDYGDLIVAGGGTCDLARIGSGGQQVACVNIPQPDSILDLDIASDGCHALLSTVHGLEIVDLCAGDGTATPVPVGPSDVYLGARFLPDGNILATHGVSANSTVKVDVVDGRGRLIRRLYDASGVATVTLDPDGRSFWVVDGATIQRIAIENGVRVVAPSRLVHGSEARRISVRGEWRAATSRSRSRAVAR
jgi:hypothetical protein